MATSTWPTQTNVTAATATGFIPEIWTDEIKASYENSLVLAPTVKRMSMRGKKGDTIHVPVPDRQSANKKVAETGVTIMASATSTFDISIDQHWEYSRHIEDIAKTQAKSSLRRFYTEDAGYALAKQLDTFLGIYATAWGDGGYVAAPTPADWVSSASFRCNGGDANGVEAWAEDSTVAADVPKDVCFRQILQKLDENDVPFTNRYWAVPPSGVNVIRGIDRYNSQDFVTNRGVQNGRIGNLYGVDILQSTNLPIMETAAQNPVTSDVSRASFVYHRDALICVEQLGIRTQTQYQQEYLATLFTADRIYGGREYRADNGFILVFPEK